MKKIIVIAASIGFIIATVLDIKYKGLLYQVIQKCQCSCNKND